MLGGVLGFNTETKKSDVAAYFKTVHDTVSSTKRSLEKIVEDMKSENNPNADATGIAVKALITNTLDKIIEGADDAVKGAEGDELLGNMAAADSGGAVGEVDKLVKGIKSIVDVVLEEGNPDAGTDKKAEDGSSVRANNSDDAGNLFGNDKAGNAAANAKKAAADAAKAVGAVTGADILQAIAKGSSGKAATLAKNNTANNNVAAVAGAKDAIVAGAIALRAMAKGGKFAGNNDAADAVVIVKDSALSAVTKALGTLTIAIRKTIDAGLKTVKDAIKFNSTDTPVITDKQTSETKGQ
ncbi:variable large family protein (plasmid) [Borrelia nietonii YOR]|nr:variable large family protein [Borrelia nietonii YOR]